LQTEGLELEIQRFSVCDSDWLQRDLHEDDPTAEQLIRTLLAVVPALRGLDCTECSPTPFLHSAFFFKCFSRSSNQIARSYLLHQPGQNNHGFQNFCFCLIPSTTPITEDCPLDLIHDPCRLSDRL
jgi:hypothetical protein